MSLWESDAEPTCSALPDSPFSMYQGTMLTRSMMLSGAMMNCHTLGEEMSLRVWGCGKVAHIHTHGQ